MKLFNSISELLRHPLGKRSLARGVAALAFSAATSLGTIAMNERNYWQVTISRTQSVDFNILANLLPHKVSDLLIKGDHQGLQKVVDTNYGLFGIIITDCRSTTGPNCPEQRILYGSRINVNSTSSGKQQLVSQDNYTRNWLEKFTNTDTPAQLLNGELYVLLRDPPPLEQEWNFASPRATEVSRLKSSDRGRIIGRVYFVRGNQPSFTAAIEKWLTSPLSKSSTNSVYNAILGTAIFTAFIVWLLSEIIHFKSIKAAESRLQAIKADNIAREAENRCKELSRKITNIADDKLEAEATASQSQTQVQLLEQAIQAAEFAASRDRDRIESLTHRLDIKTEGRQNIETAVIQSQEPICFLKRSLQSAKVHADRDRKRIENLNYILDTTIEEKQKAEQELNSLYQLIDEDRDSIRTENHQLRDRNKDLSAEVKKLKQEQKQPNISEDINLKTRLDIKDVADALKTAQEHFPALEIWENTYKEALTCLSSQPVGVYNALLKLSKVSYLHFNQELDGECFLQRLGKERVRCSRESDSTMRHPMLSRLRKFNNGDGVSITMSKHLKIGELRIYFEIDDEDRKVKIGYCGKHLPTSSER
jgi:hypothetical protein